MFSSEVALPEGVLTLSVWPTHAGALLANGEEPISNPDYRRGQITWSVGEDGVIRGKVRIDVPSGEWCYIIYSTHPVKSVVSAIQPLAHPLRISGPEGCIDLDGITEADVLPKGSQPG